MGSLLFDESTIQQLIATPISPPTASIVGQASTSSTLHSATADSELRRLKDKSKNKKKLEKSTSNWTKRFADWRKINTSSVETLATELDRILQHFFAEIENKEEFECEPDSLRTMLGALDRHFRNAGYKFRIIKDEEFTECRQVLNGKAMELRIGKVEEQGRCSH